MRFFNEKGCCVFGQIFLCRAYNIIMRTPYRDKKSAPALFLHRTRTMASKAKAKARTALVVESQQPQAAARDLHPSVGCRSVTLFKAHNRFHIREELIVKRKGQQSGNQCLNAFFLGKGISYERNQQQSGNQCLKMHFFCRKQAKVV